MPIQPHRVGCQRHARAHDAAGSRHQIIHRTRHPQARGQRRALSVAPGLQRQWLDPQSICQRFGPAWSLSQPNYGGGFHSPMQRGQHRGCLVDGRSDSNADGLHLHLQVCAVVFQRPHHRWRLHPDTAGGECALRRHNPAFFPRVGPLGRTLTGILRSLAE